MSLVLSDDDVPAKEDLQQAVSRLRHCSEILKTVKSKNYKDESPDALRRIANFLEMLAKKDM